MNGMQFWCCVLHSILHLQTYSLRALAKIILYIPTLKISYVYTIPNKNIQSSQWGINVAE